MKTPEEIKKGLEYCGKNSGDPCRGCPYERTIGDTWTCEMTHDALAYIRQLEEGIDRIYKLAKYNITHWMPLPKAPKED